LFFSTLPGPPGGRWQVFFTDYLCNLAAAAPAVLPALIHEQISFDVCSFRRCQVRWGGRWQVFFADYLCNLAAPALADLPALIYE
jgi:hypothetical protein